VACVGVVVVLDVDVGVVVVLDADVGAGESLSQSKDTQTQKHTQPKLLLAQYLSVPCV
jgi:hypothetical protein